VSLAATAAGAAGLSLIVHLLSSALAWRRCAGHGAAPAFEGKLPPVTIVQPHRGIETFSEETLASIFGLDYLDYEILFCVVSEADPIVALLERHIAANPSRPARILFGDHPISNNPKLNNIVKGWKAARRDWIVLADSNVLMPPDYLTRLLARFRADTGIVCSPPIGARPDGFAAHLECAFLNSYQARWQYAAEAAGFGFAQGKTMLWRRRLLDEAGGIEALASEIAEDAAATKIVRRAGLSPHLVERPFPQPLGRRSFGDVWRRQVRWARLRRATFAPYFLPELLTTSLVAVIAAALAAPVFDASPASAALLAAAAWYGAEAALVAGAGWPLGLWFLPAAIARDALLPWLWVQGLASDRFEWRGAALTVADLAPVRAEPSV
jgi:ceramide glucosyltransferase